MSAAEAPARPWLSLAGAWLWRALKVLFVIVLVLSAVDLGSDLGWGNFGKAYPKKRPEPQEYVEYALLVVALLWSGRHARRWVTTIRALPIPRPAFVVIGLVLLIEVVHIGIQSERYPFSNVGMFQYSVKPKARGTAVAKNWYVLQQKGKPTESVSLFREGAGPLAHRYGGLDGRTAWLLRVKPTHKVTRKKIAELVGETKHRKLVRIPKVAARMKDGKWLEPKGPPLR